MPVKRINCCLWIWRHCPHIFVVLNIVFTLFSSNRYRISYCGHGRLVLLRPKKALPFQSPTTIGSWLHICFFSIASKQHCFPIHCTGLDWLVQRFGIVFLGLTTNHVLVVYQLWQPQFNWNKFLFRANLSSDTPIQKKMLTIFVFSI